MIDDGSGDVVERPDPLDDRLFVVVAAAARLGALHQSRLHRLVARAEVDDALDRSHVSFEAQTLFELARVAVDDETATGVGFLEHRLLEQRQDFLLILIDTQNCLHRLNLDVKFI